MNSRDRVWKALNHQEPDRVPFDLGGTGLSTIHITAYQNLRRYLNLPHVAVRIRFVAEQLVLVNEDIAMRLQTDIRPLLPNHSSENIMEMWEAWQDYGLYR